MREGRHLHLGSQLSKLLDAHAALGNAAEAVCSGLRVRLDVVEEQAENLADVRGFGVLFRRRRRLLMGLLQRPLQRLLLQHKCVEFARSGE